MKHHVPHFLFCFLLVCSVLACTAAAFTPEMPELSAEIPEAVAKTALSEAAYGAKPAETTDDGVLVFFDNGNADDRINLTNISLQGVVEPFSETDGFITRSINTGDTPFQGETFGPCIVASDGVSFKDASGKRLNGKLTFCVEIYNSTASDKIFHNGVKPKPATGDWYEWCTIYTDWSATRAAASSWTTMKFTYDTSANTICMGRNAWDYNGSHIRSVYVYYAPTVSYAEKPAETTDYGRLIYFDNGNASDMVNESNITLGGLLSTLDTTDYTYTRSINTGDTVFAGNTFGVYASASDGAFTDADGNALDGKLTMCVELYNSAAKKKDFYSIQQPAADGWVSWCNVYTNWKKYPAEPGVWTTLTQTRDTSATLLGFARDAWDPNNSNIRAVYIYYKPNVKVNLATAEANSIRTGGNAGIRFAAFINAPTLAEAQECGFIVARGDILEQKGLDAADEVKIADGTVANKSAGSFAAQTASGLKLAGARNYVSDGSVTGKILETPDGQTPFGDYGEQGSYFTGVVINLDNSYTHADGTTYAHRYNTPLAARSYVKIGSVYYYGECRIKSIKDVAEAIKAAGGDAYTANKDFIDKILAEADVKA